VEINVQTNLRWFLLAKITFGFKRVKIYCLLKYWQYSVTIFKIIQHDNKFIILHDYRITLLFLLLYEAKQKHYTNLIKFFFILSII